MERLTDNIEGGEEKRQSVMQRKSDTECDGEKKTDRI